MKVWFRGFILGMGTAALVVGPAMGHVDVLPAESVVNQAQDFVIRVPVEREVATTRVRVTFPKKVVVVRFATTPGWTRRTIAGRDGSITGVDYTGGRAGRDEYAEFRLIATPIELGEALWKVEQTSADGAVKPWTGPAEKEGDVPAETGPSAPGPAAATRFVATASPASAAPGATTNDGSSPAGIWLGIIAIGIAGAAATAVGFLWSRQPMALPPDDEPLAPVGTATPAPPPKPAPAKTTPPQKRRRG